MRASSSAFPRSCNPIGNFLPFSDSANPQGTLMPQIPARFAALVKISARYICKGSVVFSPSLNAGPGRSWRNERFYFLKCVYEILTDELAHFLCTQIIGIVITGTENVSAENNSPFYFRAESFPPVERNDQTSCSLSRPMPVPDSIKAREVGRSFRRRQNIVNADGVFRMWKRNLRRFPHPVISQLFRLPAAMTALFTAGSTPSIMYSFGRPMRVPFKSRPNSYWYNPGLAH